MSSRSAGWAWARTTAAPSQAAIAVAQATHRSAQVAVDQTLIRAPFEGVVLTKNANVGVALLPTSIPEKKLLPPDCSAKDGAAPVPTFRK